jgi:hypothetical protein
MTFIVKEPKNKLKMLKPGDHGFTISNDGLSLVSRAGFEINSRCPREYKLILQECINHGWIKPVAYVTEKEFMWDELGGTNG